MIKTFFKYDKCLAMKRFEKTRLGKGVLTFPNSGNIQSYKFTFDDDITRAKKQKIKLKLNKIKRKTTLLQIKDRHFYQSWVWCVSPSF